MGITHGFKLIKEQSIKELNSTFFLYHHIQTGAELLSVVNDDENKVFGITFRTPPKDSTGVAHILEHSVLCGSKKYPVKEPFVELLKGSLQTFLNAFTYPDKTCYPVASQNEKDLYNLIDVYMDAVFYPNITPHTLEQEGWHYELDKKENPLTYKGVVFNEMKGVYSSPDSLLLEYSQQALFPDNTYGLDSGGNPRIIPELTYEQFSDFHKQYYHPSNARIYMYGDNDPQERLRVMNEYLSKFSKQKTNSTVALQPVISTPRNLEKKYAAGENSEQNGAKITLNWLLPEKKDPTLAYSLEMLEYMLLGMPASPLRKALIESGLGEDIAGCGLEDELRQSFLSTGLKGVAPDKCDEVEALILETLETIAAQGFATETIEAALNTLEFTLRENNSGSFPRGLHIMLRALTTWLYDHDPLMLLSFEAPLQNIKNKIKKEKHYFEKILSKHIIKNKHRVTLKLLPDSTKAEEDAKAEKEQLSAIKESLSNRELNDIIDNTKTLKKMQEKEDNPEDLAKIPCLKLEEIDQNIKTTPQQIRMQEGYEIHFNPLSTNGILYFDVGLNLKLLPSEFLPYAAIFGKAIRSMGTQREDYVTLSQRISRKTGGIRQQFLLSDTEENIGTAYWLFFRGKAMTDAAQDLFSIMKDIFLETNFCNRDRFRQIVLEEKARLEQHIIPAGHQKVDQRLRAAFSNSARIAEEISGINQLFFLRELLAKIENNWQQLLETLQKMAKLLINRKSMVFHVTLDKDGINQIDSSLNKFIADLPSCEPELLLTAPSLLPGSEAMLIPAQVNYVGKGINLYQHGYQYHGSVNVITSYLRTSWLWEQVRVKGGAYGAFSKFNRFSGVFTFGSYRDPNIEKTLAIYDKTAHYLKNLEIDPRELTKSIIGAIGTLDAYQLPDAKGFSSLSRSLTGTTDVVRQKIREQILNTTAEDFHHFGEVLENIATHGITTLLGYEDALGENSKLTKTRVL